MLASDPFDTVTGVAGMSGLPGAPEGGTDTGHPLDEVRDWFARYVRTTTPGDLDVLALWAVHTHLMPELWTTPRLLVDSPLPEAGKTTVLDHLDKLAYRPVKAASLSSPALLARLVKDEPRTILLDECEKNLDPKRDGVGELLAVLNSGYKRGATRPVLVPVKGGGWEAEEHPCFAPVAMAGISPNLPDDTRSRCIRVLLMPDRSGQIAESDWELITEPAEDLAERIAEWAAQIADRVATLRPELPEGVNGRGRERWSPLMRVAVAAGGRWPDAVAELARAELAELDAQRTEGLARKRPAVLLAEHIAEVWPDGEDLVDGKRLADALVWHAPEVWGEHSAYGRRLTPQRLGRMLSDTYRVTTVRPLVNGERKRGYPVGAFAHVWAGLGIVPPSAVESPPSRTPGPPDNPGTPDRADTPGTPGDQ